MLAQLKSPLPTSIYTRCIKSLCKKTVSVCIAIYVEWEKVGVKYVCFH